MKKRRRLMLSDEGGENFWPSFTDLISTVSMILFVLVLLAYIQNLIAGKNLQSVRSQLDATLLRLRNSQVQIASSEKKLKLLAAEIEAGQTQLALSRAQIDQQQAIIAESTKELGSVRSKLQGIAVLRLDVLRKVKQSIDEQLSKGNKSAAAASIAENGNIVIDESVVFEYDSYTLKQDGKRFLASLAAAFAKVLDDAEVRQNIDVILVQGHTDQRGTVTYNRELSSKRANTVLNYMFSADNTLERSYGSYFASSGYSEFRPINPANTEAAYQQNRRIEISVVLKDSNVRDTIDEYMKNARPLPGAAKP